MKLILLTTAVGLTFIGASAQFSYAQPSPQQDTGSNFFQYGQPQESPGDTGGDWQQLPREHSWRYSQNEPNESTKPSPGAPPPPPPAPHHPPPPPPPANAAHFVFQRGRARIDITCPQVFALNDCIQAATELLNKIHSLRDGARDRGASSSPGNDDVQGPDSGGGKNRQTAPGGGGGPQIVVPNSDDDDNRM